jgi:hypothetical protein
MVFRSQFLPTRLILVMGQRERNSYGDLHTPLPSGPLQEVGAGGHILGGVKGVENLASILIGVASSEP